MDEARRVHADALDGEVALVTGASRGIGRRSRLRWRRPGATVVGTATSAAGAAVDRRALASRAKGAGAVLDVNDAAACEASSTQCTREHGKLSDPGQQRRHHARQPAAAHEGRGMGRRSSTPTSKSVFRLSRGGAARHDEGAPRAHHQHHLGGGEPSATRARRTTPPRRPASTASRKSLAREVGSRNITVNCVAPGFIDTDMTRALAASSRRCAARADAAGAARAARGRRAARGVPRSPAAATSPARPCT